MDKEYLSLMAELGEAPVPSSGGHSMSQGGAPRVSGANSQAPMVSLQTLSAPPTCRRGHLEPVSHCICFCAAQPAPVDELQPS